MRISNTYTNKLVPLSLQNVKSPRRNVAQAIKGFKANKYTNSEEEAAASSSVASFGILVGEKILCKILISISMYGVNFLWPALNSRRQLEIDFRWIVYMTPAPLRHRQTLWLVFYKRVSKVQYVENSSFPTPCTSISFAEKNVAQKLTNNS